MRLIQFTVFLICVSCPQLRAEDLSPAEYFSAFNAYTHLENIDSEPGREVVDYLVPLGAIEKIRGVWSPRRSERQSGVLQSYTWRVLDGYTAHEMVDEFDQRLALNETTLKRFACDARACGSSVQWANRIFQQRLLYGTEASQRYRVYDVTVAGESYRILIYGSARSSDRQYFHAEALKLAP